MGAGLDKGSAKRQALFPYRGRVTMKWIISLSLIGLTACATAYKPSGFAGGFEETALAPNVYRVSFDGNGYTSSTRAEELALLRSADLTLQKGFKFFGLADSNLENSISTHTTPVTSTTTVNANAYGNSIYGTANTTTTGGQTYLMSKPSAKNLVVMFEEKPEVLGMIFDAAFICESIGAKYKVTCGER